MEGILTWNSLEYQRPATARMDCSSNGFGRCESMVQFAHLALVAWHMFFFVWVVKRCFVFYRNILWLIASVSCCVWNMFYCIQTCNLFPYVNTNLYDATLHISNTVFRLGTSPARLNNCHEKRPIVDLVWRILNVYPREPVFSFLLLQWDNLKGTEGKQDGV